MCIRDSLTAGQHGSTFGGNPLACASALAVLDTIESAGLVEAATALGDHLARSVAALDHPVLGEARGVGLLRAIPLQGIGSSEVVAAAREAGFIVNPVAPDTIRLAPPLTVTTTELDSFVAALPAILEAAAPTPSTTSEETS